MTRQHMLDQTFGLRRLHCRLGLLLALVGYRIGELRERATVVGERLRLFARLRQDNSGDEARQSEQVPLDAATFWVDGHAVSQAQSLFQFAGLESGKALILR